MSQRFIRVLASVAALAGCARQQVITRVVMPALPDPPAQLAFCPAPAPEPPPPPLPRTIEQVGRWAIETERARERTAWALDECRRRLERLNNWIDAHQSGA